MGNDDSGVLPEVIEQLMKSPEIGNILSALGKGGKGPEAAPEKEASAEKGESQFSLPPDFAEKLPAIMAVLSGMGTGGGGKSGEAGKESRHDSGRRRALLKALRPYLSPRRQTVVDSFIGLESVTGLFELYGKSDKKGGM